MSVIFFPSTVFDCHYSIKCSMFFDDDIVVIEKKRKSIINSMNATLIIIIIISSILFPGIPSALRLFNIFLMIGTCETIRIMKVQQQNQILPVFFEYNFILSHSFFFIFSFFFCYPLRLLRGLIV